MPFNLSRITFIILMLGFSSKMYGHVGLDYPVGGETYIQGQTVSIQWHIVAFHVQLNWDLYFSEDGGNTWQPIQLDIPTDSLSYNWIVPAVITSQGRIKIFQDNVEHDYLDTSLDFNIEPNTSPPSLDAPAANLTIECSASQESTIQSWLNNHGGAVATHYCGDLIWTHDYAGLSNDCGNTGSSLVTFTAEDDCGSTHTVAIATIVDNSPPSINVMPHDLVVECNGLGNISELNAWLAIHGGAIATDACSNVTWANDFTNADMNCGATGQVMVSFTATDACGNSVHTTAMFVINDHIAPQISDTAHDTILECGNANTVAIQNWLNHHGGAQANDICGNVSWLNNYSALSDSCGNAGDALVIFTATDECGNISTASATISIQDHLAPVLDSAAQDLILYCTSPNLNSSIVNWLNINGGAKASDVCGNVNWSHDYISPGDTCISVSKIVSFTATDDCGNSSVSQALLTILDTTTHSIDTTVFAPVGATWYYSSASSGPPRMANALSCLFLVEKDTLMSGFSARVIGFYLNNEGHLERIESMTKYIATVGNRVYYKVADSFVLLYDFGAQAGDTIHSKAEHYGFSLGCLDPDSIVDFSYIIDSVWLQQIDGEDLIAQYVRSIEQFPGDNWGFWQFEPIYERIGSSGWGGFWWGRGLGCIFEAGSLRCYVDDKITVHGSGVNTQYPCDYLSSSEIDPERSPMIFPNPTSGLISRPENAQHFSLFSIEGKPASFILTEKEIDISGNSSGIYIIKFEIGKQAYFSKIVLR